MDLRQLRYFVKVVECGNVTHASEALHVAQPAVSQQMRNLEQDLGMQLLERSVRGVAPTAAGVGAKIVPRMPVAWHSHASSRTRPMPRKSLSVPSVRAPIRPCCISSA